MIVYAVFSLYIDQKLVQNFNEQNQSMMGQTEIPSDFLFPWQYDYEHSPTVQLMNRPVSPFHVESWIYELENRRADDNNDDDDDDYRSTIDTNNRDDSDWMMTAEINPNDDKVIGYTLSPENSDQRSITGGDMQSTIKRKDKHGAPSFVYLEERDPFDQTFSQKYAEEKGYTPERGPFVFTGGQSETPGDSENPPLIKASKRTEPSPTTDMPYRFSYNQVWDSSIPPITYSLEEEEPAFPSWQLSEQTDHTFRDRNQVGVFASDRSLVTGSDYHDHTVSNEARRSMENAFCRDTLNNVGAAITYTVHNPVMSYAEEEETLLYPIESQTSDQEETVDYQSDSDQDPDRSLKRCPRFENICQLTKHTIHQTPDYASVQFSHTPNLEQIVEDEREYSIQQDDEPTRTWFRKQEAHTTVSKYLMYFHLCDNNERFSLI